MKTSFLNLSLAVLTAGLLPLLASGCLDKEAAQRDEEARQRYEEMRAEMEAKKDPRAHLPEVRSYAQEQLILSDEEADFILAEEPKILTKSDQMMLIFFWKAPDWPKGVQVVTSPPPNCSPLMAKRLARPIFP